MIDKDEHFEKVRDDLRVEQEKLDVGVGQFKRAANTKEYKAALQEIPFLEEPEAVKKGMQLLKDKREDMEVRLLVLQKAISAIAQSAEYVRDCLLITEDKSDQIELRRAAFNALKVFNFASNPFVALRPEFMTALRTLLDDPDAALREMAAEELAKDKDEYVQRRLLDGLTGREEPIVSTAKAIQLLSYDIHTEQYPVVRRILENPASDETVKVEAIHALANDAESKNLLARLMMDKQQPIEVRMSSAVALKTSDFEDFSKIAKPLVTDENEEKDMRSAVLNALMHHRESKALYDDNEFMQKVRNLRSLTTSGDLKKLTTRFLDSARRQSKKR